MKKYFAILAAVHFFTTSDSFSSQTNEEMLEGKFVFRDTTIYSVQDFNKRSVIIHDQPALYIEVKGMPYEIFETATRLSEDELKKLLLTNTSQSTETIDSINKINENNLALENKILLYTGEPSLRRLDQRPVVVSKKNSFIEIKYYETANLYPKTNSESAFIINSFEEVNVEEGPKPQKLEVQGSIAQTWLGRQLEQYIGSSSTQFLGEKVLGLNYSKN